MEFESFEQALAICMTAEPGSEAQNAALAHCLENAPADLKEKIKDGLARFHARKGGCGHSHCDCE